MSGSKWKLVGEGSSGRHLTGKRHSHRIQPRSFLSLPLLASPLSSFFLRHLFRWRVATRPFYLDNLQAREVSSLATLWMNEWTNWKRKIVFSIFLKIWWITVQHISLSQFTFYISFFKLFSKFNRLFYKNFVPKFSFHISFLKIISKIFVKLKFSNL